VLDVYKEARHPAIVRVYYVLQVRAIFRCAVLNISMHPMLGVCKSQGSPPGGGVGCVAIPASVAVEEALQVSAG